RAEVSENYFKYLKSISSANFRTAYDNSTYKLSDLNGKLISYGKTSGNSSFYIPVTFEFDNIGDIIPGSFTEVYLLSTVRDDVLSVPLTALTEEQGLHFVYVRTEPEAYIKKEVTIGQNDGERVEIIKGLKAGDTVVTKGVTQVKLASASGAIPDGHNH
ncbi:MAG: efflux RND transporter periplasmic adaptor subunit, partial [Bacteroidales bacterium]